MTYILQKEFTTISRDIIIKDALKYLDYSKIKALFIVDGKNKLIGTITDGDIRRFLYSHEPNLNISVSEIMNINPKYILEKDFTNSSDTKLLNYGVNHLPIVDEQLRIKSIIEFNINFELINKLDNPVVIMAGGKGNRLLPLTKVIPKPLVPFKGKTMIENIIDNFIVSGFNNFYISVNYKKELIKQYFKDLTYNVHFLEESIFLGTAGSLNLLKEFKINKPIFVTNCDILLNINYAEILNYHNLEKADITIVGAVKNINISYGVLTVDKNGSFLEIKEKPDYNFLINSGVYILNPNIIDLIKDNEIIDMPDLILKAKNKNLNVKIYPTSKEVLDIGQWKYYKEYIDLE